MTRTEALEQAARAFHDGWKRIQETGEAMSEAAITDITRNATKAASDLAATIGQERPSERAMRLSDRS